MLTTKADRHNELAGIEIESKLKIVSDQAIADVAQVIFNSLLDSVYRFKIATSLTNVISSNTIVRHYAYKKPQGKIRKLFTITQRDKDGLLQIKNKGPKVIYYQNVLRKTESIEPIAWTEWTKDVELSVINSKIKSLDKTVKSENVFLVTGIAKRQKIKIRVINKHNNRAYTIGIDETTAPNKSTLRQIEIEYIGVELPPHALTNRSPHSFNNLTEFEIATEIKSIETILIKICDKANIILKMTQQSKFKWLRKMHHVIDINNEFNFEKDTKAIAQY
ncbi:MAG: phage antirepressor YoqD-like protein [Cocleimonas sp.]|jgi:phage antirepressor YoqD-like protein